MHTALDEAVRLTRTVSGNQVEGGSIMEAVHDDRFVVILRSDDKQTKTASDGNEQPLAYCSTYGEARRIRAALHGSAAGECVIRYVGPAGGGD